LNQIESSAADSCRFKFARKQEGSESSHALKLKRTSSVINSPCPRSNGGGGGLVAAPLPAIVANWGPAWFGVSGQRFVTLGIETNDRRKYSA